MSRHSESQQQFRLICVSRAVMCCFIQCQWWTSVCGSLTPRRRVPAVLVETLWKRCGNIVEALLKRCWKLSGDRCGPPSFASILIFIMYNRVWYIIGRRNTFWKRKSRKFVGLQRSRLMKIKQTKGGYLYRLRIQASYWFRFLVLWFSRQNYCNIY